MCNHTHEKCACVHVLMHCCNCVCVHVCMCTCANVLLHWCQWCLCAWACAYTHHACVHVLLCCCACACCMCICISKSFVPSTHMCNHTHEKEVLTHWHAVLTLPLQKKGHTKLLKLVNKQPQCWHAVLTLPWQNKDKQKCSSMLSMRLTSACPLVPQATDPQAGWAIFLEVLTML